MPGETTTYGPHIDEFLRDEANQWTSVHSEEYRAAQKILRSDQLTVLVALLESRMTAGMLYQLVNVHKVPGQKEMNIPIQLDKTIHEIAFAVAHAEAM